MAAAGLTQSGGGPSALPGGDGRSYGAEVATWEEFCAFAEANQGRRLSATGWVFDAIGSAADRSQKVFAFLEVLPPGFEILQVKSAFAEIEEVDVEAVVRRLGQLSVGAIGYTPGVGGLGEPTDGYLNLTSSIPLAAIDLSDPLPLTVFLAAMAEVTDDLERHIHRPQDPDTY